MAATELPPDFTPLNPAEREVLGLLAQGHTAKSIATLTGKTVGSVNERLREARRKTGIASSRELARLLAESRKNRDEQIGVGELPPGNAPKARRFAWRGPRAKGVIAMGIFTGVATLGAVIFALQDAPAGSGSVAADPMLGGAWPAQAASPPSLEKLHAQLRSEARDVDWAGQVEPAVKSRYAQIVGPGEMLRVTCGATLCEVAGALPEGKKASAALDAVQGRALYADIVKLGFSSDLFTVTSADQKGLVFVSYWRRK